MNKEEEVEVENKLIELAKERNKTLKTIEMYIFIALFVPVVITVAYYAYVM